uniref:Uncharacterized protein n=1 Tax=Pipistrellus kuhlii TaxID=59472 RepID=A0A7J7Y7I8_PIPKU|nr:hypothetical protein mPipKuh1_001383 [Pipistrellus kuhlii]
MVGRSVSMCSGRSGATEPSRKPCGGGGGRHRRAPRLQEQLPRPASPMFELPALCRTEDRFPAEAGGQRPSPRCRPRL